MEGDYGLRRGALVAILIAAFFLILSVYQVLPVKRMAPVSIGGQEFRLEVADTAYLQRRGLSGRKSIPDDGGMLFLFDRPRHAVFWMKGMRVPIDIIWIRGDSVVGYVSLAAPPAPGVPDELIERFPAPEPVDRVIELRAGRAGELGLRIGQRIDILLP